MNTYLPLTCPDNNFVPPPHAAAAACDQVQGKYWTFEDLVIVGTCTPANHGLCEHAFHVTHDADFFVMRNSVLRDFNAMLKVAGGGE